MTKTKITLEIKTDLYLASKNELNMSLADFVEFSLSMFINNDDQYSKIFRKASEHYNEFNRLREKMQRLESKHTKNKNNQDYYENAMITVNRIHDRLGYIGKNQLRKIANQNDLSPMDLINYVSNFTEYTVTNFGDSPKQR